MESALVLGGRAQSRRQRDLVTIWDVCECRKASVQRGGRACEGGIMRVDGEEAGRGRTKARPALERRKDQEAAARCPEERSEITCQV